MDKCFSHKHDDHADHWFMMEIVFFANDADSGPPCESEKALHQMWAIVGKSNNGQCYHWNKDRKGLCHFKGL